MLRGKKDFKCDVCGHIFKSWDFELMATVLTLPQPCPECGSWHTIPSNGSLFWGKWDKSLYQDVWESQAAGLWREFSDEPYMKGVRFMPRVGKNYEHSQWGKRVMVMEEFLSIDDPRVAMPDLTNKRMEEMFDRNVSPEAWMVDYAKFASLLTGEREDRFTSQKVWNDILFCSYLQLALKEGNDKPVKGIKEISKEPFLLILEKYQPDVVFAWHRHSFEDYLPTSTRQGQPIHEVPTYIYRLSNGHEVTLLPVTHPSAGFSPDRWQPIIHKLLTK